MTLATSISLPRKFRILIGFVCISIFLILISGSSARNTNQPSITPADSGSTGAISAAYTKLPLSFERNEGQTAEQVRFTANGDGYQLFLTDNEAVLALRQAEAKDNKEKGGYRVVRMRLLNANENVQTSGLEMLPGKLNYFIGNNPDRWRTDVSLFAKVRYQNVYDGINLIYYGTQRQLEYDFEVRPGIDPRAIKLRFEGTDHVKVDKTDGSLVLAVNDREVRFKSPLIYQLKKDGTRAVIKGGYRLTKGSVSFAVDEFDASLPLIIDPILSYSTYLGAAQNESGLGIAVDSLGSAYISGQTGSFAFPTTGVNFIPADNSTGHAFVTKLDPSGSSLVYSTLIGGGNDDPAFAIAVDSSGAAHITGRTSSNNFPTLNAIRGNFSLLKSTNSGSSWNASDAGLANLAIYDIAVTPGSPNILYAAAASGNGVYKSTDGGATWSGLNTGANFVQALAINPQTPNIIYGAARGPFFGIIKSVDAGATWSQTSLSGASMALAIDPVTPMTIYASTFSGIFKSTNSGATWQPANTGITSNGLPVVVIDPSNTATVYAAGSNGVWKTTNGGGNWSPINSGLTSATNSLAVDPSTPSTLYAGTFAGVFKSINGGSSWAPMNTGLTTLVVTSLLVDPSSSSIVYAGTTNSKIFKSIDGGATWTTVYSGLGGFPGPSVEALAFGTSGNFFAGVETRNSVDNEAFDTKLNASGNALIFSTYLGGNGSDEGDGIAVDSTGNVLIAGGTASADFPLANPPKSTLQGLGDGFVTKFNSSGALVYSTYLGGQFFDIATAIAVDSSGNAYVTGNTVSPNFPTTAGAFQTTPTGNDAFVTKLDPSGSSFVYSTFLGGNDSDLGFAIAVDTNGNAYVAGATSSTNFPTLNPFQATGGGFSADAFVSKLNSSGTGLIYSSYLGGSQGEQARGIAIDASGNAYLTGATSSIDFPVTSDAIRKRNTLFKTTNGGALWTNNNFGLMGGINQVVVHPTNSNIVFAATTKGVFKSLNGGLNWSASNSGISDPFITALAIDPTNPSIVYASPRFDPASGIYKSTNGGSTWVPANGNLSFNSAGPITIDPVNPGTVYLAAGFKSLKTIDGGAHWIELNTGMNVNSFLINPQNTQQLFIYSDFLPFGGLERSNDGGGSWTTVDTGLTSRIVHHLTIDPQNPSTLYAATDDGLFKTDNSGGLWERSLNKGFVTDVVIDPLHPSILYASGFSDSAPAFIFKTTNGGSSWTQVSNGLDSSIGILAIDPVNPNNVFAVGLADSGSDAFVTKVNPSGNALSYSTFLGGKTGSSGTNDSGSAIAVDASGNAYVTGIARSIDFPVTADAFQPINRGLDDAFVSKVTNTFSISGVVTDGSTPQANVNLTLTGSATGSLTTSTAGTYEFVNLVPGGTFTVGATKSGFSATPPSHTFTNINANQVANFTIAPAATSFHTISGQIVVLESLVPLVGANVALTGSQTEFTTTDANGNYSFSAPDGGNYTITPTLLGFNVLPASNSVNNLHANTTLNFQSLRVDFLVTNENDHGAGSLRQAMLDANTTQGADRISFAIPGAGVHTINLTSPLPTITDPVTIDGSTQPGFAGLPLIELNGSGVGIAANGITITGGNSIVRSLVINRFEQSGISLEMSGLNRIEGNIIGLDPLGSIKRANNGNGISISQESFANVIGGTTSQQRNVISGNNANGIAVFATGTTIQGNFIGTNATGNDALGNGNHGILLENLAGLTFGDNLIGGTSPDAGNLISGNGRNGINVSGPGGAILGNLVGTDISGTVKLPNTIGINITGNSCMVGGGVATARNVVSGNGTGINVSPVVAGLTASHIYGNYIGTDPTGTIGVGNGQGLSVSGPALIGSFVTDTGNLISGNDGPGIQLNCCNPGFATIQGNSIGTNAAGDQSLGNAVGISIQSPSNVIGGSESGAGNVISGNQVGIAIGGQTTSAPDANVIKGNLIGVSLNRFPLGNSTGGIRLDDATNTTIGGNSFAETNVIRFNGGAGIYVSSSSLNNSIDRNWISSNAGLGIDLNNDGVTQNDAGDTDTGANRRQNFPIVAFGGTNGFDGVVVHGTFNSTPNTQFRLNFYGNAACDISGHGEGARPLGSATVTTDANGFVEFSAGFEAFLDFHRAITATATDPAGNNSEFSPCDATDTTGDFEFSSANFNALEDVGNAIVRVRRTGGNIGTGITVRYASGGGTATPGVDYTPVNGTLSFNAGEVEKTISIPINNDGLVELEETVNLTLSFDFPPDIELLGAHYQTTLHIQDANTPLSLAVDPQAFDGYQEGNFGTRNTNVTVRLNAQTSRTVSVDYSAFAGSATANVDFLPVSGTLTFAPGTESQDIVVPFIGDVLDENNETIDLQLSNPVNASLLTPSVMVPIIDDDPLPRLTVTDVGVVEGAAAKAVFSVALDAPSNRSVQVSFTTTGGTGTPGTDYRETSGSLIFAPGETLKQVEVTILTDGVAEPDETFLLNLFNPQRAAIADAQGQGTIMDSSSSSSVVQFNAAGYTANEGDGQVQITVIRSNGTGTATVHYKTAGGTASNRTDYTTAEGDLRFDPGVTSQSFNVLLTDDAFVEPVESVSVALSNSSGAVLGGPNVVPLNIISDDLIDGGSPVRDASFNTAFFVRQHYHDFLNREPDAAGLAFWMNEIDSCPDAQCREVKKINVSAAFFLSIEFQETGYLVYRTYRAAYGTTISPHVVNRVPIIRLSEFLPDSQQIGRGVQVGTANWEQQLENNKVAYFQEFVQRQRFLGEFPLSLTPAQFVEKLDQRAGRVLSEAERDQLVTELTNASNVTQGRASVLRKVAEDPNLNFNEKNRAFVLMQYYGYLRRNPDDPQDADFQGWQFWLNKLDQLNGNFVNAEMVKAFITSSEYADRFGR
jgi:hypothetical protein